MSYDQAIERLEQIVKKMEQPDIIPMDDYTKIAREATELIAFCQKHLTTLEKEINDTLAEE
ncbi:MAG: exodeoxyribonuclease VII small subunit [Paludibacteraceae bacterium]|nr:exodeoxyribonuclease VII small subunit [Paludibacteraceae bacterium]